MYIPVKGQNPEKRFMALMPLSNLLMREPSASLGSCHGWRRERRYMRWAAMI